MEITGQNVRRNQGPDTLVPNLPIWKVILLIFIPTTLTTLAYLLVGPLVQDTIPALLLFFLLAILILFPIEIFVVLRGSKREYGRYSLESAFSIHQKQPWWKILLFGVLLWGFAGLMTVTVLPLEGMLFAPAAERFWQALPAYFNWTNIEALAQYPRSTLILTCVVLFIFNVFVGPIVEELFFRGYLTARLSRFGGYAPVIVTVLFSLYHLWLPFDNLFRIAAFLPGFYVAWKLKNIYIAMVVHVLSNLFSTIGLIIAISAFF
jgi:uncharacterized protein